MLEMNNESTVALIKQEHDWGKILYNACFVFNKNLSDYYEEYVNKYDNGEIFNEDLKKETEEITKKRNDILSEKDRLKKNIQSSNENIQKYYKEFQESLMVGEIVKHYRNTNHLFFTDEKIDDYNKKIKEIKNIKKNYNRSIVEKINYKKEERKFIINHLFETRELGTLAKKNEKTISFHQKSLNYPMKNDYEFISNFIKSEKMIEILMGVCINILNTYSEKEFNTLMNNVDKEKISDYIFEFFRDFKHNYDFIAGCYEEDENNNLKVKDIEKLTKKFYNGYYFTIRGLVQRAYSLIRNEHFNILSSDQLIEENSNNEIESENILENRIIVKSYSDESNDGMFDFWNNCKKYMFKNINSMSSEFLMNMKKDIPNMNYYYDISNKHMNETIISILKEINMELFYGRNVKNKFKYIVLNSIGGTETKKEWKIVTKNMESVIKKYMKMFFVKNEKELNSFK